MLRLKESPFAHMAELDTLFQELSRSKRAVTDTIGSIMDTFDTLVPKERLLIPLSTRL